MRLSIALLFSATLAAQIGTYPPTSSGGGSPTGAAGGGLTGTYPNPGVGGFTKGTGTLTGPATSGTVSPTPGANGIAQLDASGNLSIGTTVLNPTTGVTAPAFVGTGSDPFSNFPSNTGHSASSGDLWNNAGALKFNNGTATVNIVQNIASGSTAMGTGAISSATCATVVTATATNTATTDVVTASFNGDPTAVTGYVPLTTGMLTIIAYPTSGNVNFKVCNNTNSSVTPGAITLNWKVAR